MKILLIMPNLELKYNYAYPIGLPYISSYLKSKGYHIDCINLNLESEDLLSSLLDKIEYDYVGIGGMSPDYNRIDKLIKNFLS